MDITGLLRKTIPRPLLRELALVVNTVKIYTWDRLIYTRVAYRKEQFKLSQISQPYLAFLNFADQIQDNRIRTAIMGACLLEDEVYILEDKNIYIEPEHGWGFKANRALSYFSLSSSRVRFLRKPSIIKMISKPGLVKFDKAISLRDVSERAYFHLYNDILSKLYFLQERGIDLYQYTIIVSARLATKAFFKDSVDNSAFLSSLTWHVQDREYIYCKEAIFCKPESLSVKLFDRTVEIFNIHSAQRGNRRIFLKRHRKRLRYIENENEIELILRKYGFETIDADELSLEEQASLFSNTRYLVGIHGGGLTNIVFRKDNPLDLIEIFPPRKKPPHHYAFLCAKYGFNYQAMSGEPERWRSRYSGGFEVNPKELEILTLQMLPAEDLAGKWKDATLTPI